MRWIVLLLFCQSASAIDVYDALRVANGSHPEFRDFSLREHSHGWLFRDPDNSRCSVPIPGSIGLMLGAMPVLMRLKRGR